MLPRCVLPARDDEDATGGGWTLLLALQVVLQNADIGVIKGTVAPDVATRDVMVLDWVLFTEESWTEGVAPRRITAEVDVKRAKVFSEASLSLWIELVVCVVKL